MTREPTEMEKRVAQALIDHGDVYPHDFCYIDAARAAIRAMRISTLSMSEAGDKLIDKAYKNGAYEDSEYVWTAMIDAALGEK